MIFGWRCLRSAISSHDYDGVIVKEYCQKIICEYIDTLYEFQERVVKILETAI